MNDPSTDWLALAAEDIPPPFRGRHDLLTRESFARRPSAVQKARLHAARRDASGANGSENVGQKGRRGDRTTGARPSNDERLERVAEGGEGDERARALQLRCRMRDRDGNR